MHVACVKCLGGPFGTRYSTSMDMCCHCGMMEQNLYQVGGPPGQACKGTVGIHIHERHPKDLGNEEWKNHHFHASKDCWDQWANHELTAKEALRKKPDGNKVCNETKCCACGDKITTDKVGFTRGVKVLEDMGVDNVPCGIQNPRMAQAAS